MQWLQDPNQNNVDNLNIRCAANRHFRIKKKEYLKTDELETKSKIKKYRRFV